jgi:alkaline phosphatase D
VEAVTSLLSGLRDTITRLLSRLLSLLGVAPRPPAGPPPPPQDAVFPQSVASGDPVPHGAVLWTRVDLTALGTASAAVSWVVARDPQLSDIVASGTTTTDAGRDGTVKVLLDDPALQPATHYWYRFAAGGAVSTTGRMRTLPGPDQQLDRLRLGYVCCQDWTNGYFTALGALADADVDYVLHLGDYVYETTNAAWQGRVRSLTLPDGGEVAVTLADYRSLYRTYRGDPHLRRVHEQHTFLVIWDDHEFSNDCFGVHPSDVADPPAQPERRAAATRAWVEYLPTATLLSPPATTSPEGGISYDPSLPPTEQLRMWREVRFGTLVHAFLTDERLHRSAHACGEQVHDKYLVAPCADVFAADRTMLGAEQREWFVTGITGSDATWKVWANETMLMQLKLLNTHLEELLADLPPFVAERLRKHLPPQADGVLASLDQWDGYQAERTAIARRLLDADITDMVTLTGDLHSSVAGWSRADYDAPEPFDLAAAVEGRVPADAPRGDLVGTCFMVTSVSAANLVDQLRITIARLIDLPIDAPELPGADGLAGVLRLSNRHLALFESDDHGYNTAEFTPEQLTVTYWTVSSITDPAATTVRAEHRFVVPRQTGPGAAPLVRRVH